jgi:hypothetical protein
MNALAGHWITSEGSVSGMCCALSFGPSASCEVRLWRPGRSGCLDRSSDFITLGAAAIVLPDNQVVILAEKPLHSGTQHLELRLSKTPTDLRGQVYVDGEHANGVVFEQADNRRTSEIGLAPLAANLGTSAQEELSQGDAEARG